MAVFILENVNKVFKGENGEHKVLNDITITFPDKGLISIVGKSGSGKSTLLNLLMGIEKPTSGSILFKGKDISKFSDKNFSNYHLSGVSLVFQHYNLFNFLTSKENVVLPLLMKGESKRKANQKADEFFRKLNIESLANRKVKNLSGGEKQRIAILRSIITNPFAILCDEPTGALDYKNSQEIMGILKKISCKTLVIMVSHNKTLVNKYSDQIVTLKDGKFIKSESKVKDSFTTKFDPKKDKYKSLWVSKFARAGLRRNFSKNLFSIISCAIGFSVMFLSVGFTNGSKKSQDEALSNNLSIGYATISKSEYIEIKDSPLSYQKLTRPSVDEVDEILNEFTTVRYEENFSYFLSSYPSCQYGDQSFNNFQFTPVYDLSLKSYGQNLLKAGRTGGNNFEEILVNEEFAKLFDSNILYKDIILKNTASITYKTHNENNPFIKDKFILNKPFTIVGIVKEFPFLNTPKIYYSYLGAKSFLKNQRMENLSEYLNKSISYYDYLSTCEPDDPVGSYSSYLFLNDLSEQDQFFSRILELRGSSIEITSNVFDIKNTYDTFISSFSKTLIVFSVIAFAGINFILGMISLSTFLENKKDTAIMTCLGSRDKSIFRLYLEQNYVLIIISFALSILLALVLQKLLNPLVYSKFGLMNLISIPFSKTFLMPYGLVIGLLIVAIIFSSIFTITPMMFYRKKSIADELRDE